MENIESKECYLGLPDIGIPAEVLFHPELSEVEKLLFGFLRNLSVRKEGCTASNAFLAGLIRRKGQTVSNAVAKLKQWHFILAEYERTDSGNLIRRIFINPKYPQIYRELVVEANEKLNVGVLTNLYPSISRLIYPITRLISPYKSVNNKIDIEDDIKEHSPVSKTIPENAYSDHPLSSNKHTEENSPDQTETNPFLKVEPVAPSSNNGLPKAYLILAQRLYDAVYARIKVKHSPRKISAWAKSIQRLVEQDEVDLVRIRKALRWYSVHMRENQYVPDIQSGEALREKFGRLEAAMERHKTSSGETTYLPQLLPTFARDEEWMQTIFPDKDGQFYSALLAGKKHICSWYAEAQKPRRPTQEELTASLESRGKVYDGDRLWVVWVQVIPSGPRLVEKYAKWLLQQQDDWLTTPISPKMFDPEYSLFKQFLDWDQHSVGGVNFLTGGFYERLR